MKFWDASALLHLLVKSPASPRLESLWKRDPEVVLWWGAPVDCEEALAAAGRRGGLKESDRHAAQALLDRLRNSAFEIQPQEEIRSRALRLLALHSLSASQAFELAAALVWCRERTRGMSFVSLAGPLRDAATREGFRVLPYGDQIHEDPDEGGGEL